MPIATVNPATGETLETFDALGEEEVGERLERARTAFAAHRTRASGGVRGSWGRPPTCSSRKVGTDAVARILRDPRRGRDAHRQRTRRAVGRLHRGPRRQEDRAGAGRSDPYLVLPSAGLGRAARTAVTARAQNNGQSCIAAERFIVHTSVYEESAQRFVRGMTALTVGDPMDEETDVGPLAGERGRQDLEEPVDDARRRGASVLAAAAAPRRPPGKAPEFAITERSGTRTRAGVLIGKVRIVVPPSSRWGRCPGHPGYGAPLGSGSVSVVAGDIEHRLGSGAGSVIASCP